MQDKKGARIPVLLAASLIALLLGALTWPALAWLWQAWLGDPTYSHGPIVPLLSLLCAWRLFRRGAVQPAAASAGRQEAPFPALILTLCSLGLLLWGMAVQALYLALLACLPLIVGMVGYVLGTSAAQKAAFPVAYLALAVPLPWVQAWGALLQGWTAAWSTTVARSLGIQAAHAGGRVVLAACELAVGAPCSGLRSLVALLALAAAMAYVLDGRPWARGLLVVLAVPVALIANVGRVVVLLVIAGQWGCDAALRAWHGGSGLAFFALALAWLIALGRGLGCRCVRADL